MGDRILYTNLWFGGHNNPRYAELLPRLRRLDGYLIHVSERRLLRALEYRALRATRYVRDPVVFAVANRRYRWLFTADNEQIRHFSGPVVSDVDDPKFTTREVDLLNRSNLSAFVVTAERAARRLEKLGVQKPWHVIPQGVSLRSVDPRAVADIAARHRRDGDVVVGHMAAWLLSSGDRGGGEPLYNVDHLLELWDEIRRSAPQARLWLVGGASERVRARCAGRGDIVVFGRLPRPAALAHAANFDLALYARTEDQGVQAAKVAEYMGLGVPTVSYDFEVTAELRETGAGILVETPREFAETTVRLVNDDAERARLAHAARVAGAARDWDVLARRYEDEVLDRYLR